ncbi:aldolase/citrate lyase family protein [Devosia algicola]|uniref:Aldolase/citrate lyase family protein n=1 Tax=Devosia algicola TaxID=3026418 RepID=A0ABY7YRC5_9HYPH|nr:aldolase/citrate lyase family protein [Devosia algicola]WDR03888.1 aldolase/citrate lyase family protein [Devosia algicola]
MRPNTLKQRIRDNQPIVSAWLSIPSGYSAEILARQGFDCVNVDLQHGMIGFDHAVPMLQAISATDAIPIVRVGNSEPAAMMKLLDAGAYGVICPMISNVEDAQTFVSACRYPPHGNRSFGPARGLLYGGADYAKHANDEILTIGMIETREGLDNVDAIAAVDGLDGLFIGPNDLSLALGKAPMAEPTDPEVVAAIAKILEAAQNQAKVAGIFCSSPAAAAKRIAQGFGFVVPGNDAGMLTQAGRNAVAGARANPAADAGNTKGGSGY